MAFSRRFLVASDLSRRADKALSRAVQLALEQQATLTVLFVQEAQLFTKKSWAWRVAAEAKKALRQKINTLLLQNGQRVTIRTVTGKAFVEIIRQAREEQADVVIVGAHGEHFLKDLFIGTTAEKVVRKGDRAVLVVKQSPHGPYQRVLVPVDFSGTARRALELALQLAPEAEVHVLHAYGVLFEERLRLGGVSQPDLIRYRQEVGDRARQAMRDFLRDVNLRNKPIERIVRHGRPSAVIRGVAERIGADLVAVGTAGRTGLSHILLGSVAEHVLREVSCDVLVVRPDGFRFELP